MRKLHLPSFTTELSRIIAGSLIVVWSIPNEIAAHVKKYLEKTDMRDFYEELGILSITIDGEDSTTCPSSNQSG